LFQMLRADFIDLLVADQGFICLLLCAFNGEEIVAALNYVFDLAKHRVAFHFPGGTESLRDFPANVLLRVLHENGRVGVRFGHFLLALLDSR